MTRHRVLRHTFEFECAVGGGHAYEKRRQRRRRLGDGFTLIELLVVIAIISLLVSILLPSLKKAKDLAKNVLCLSDLRSMGVAVHVYASENDEWLPFLENNTRQYWYSDWLGAGSITPGPQGLGLLFHGRYVDNSDLFLCPSEADHGVNLLRGTWDGTSTVQATGYSYRMTGNPMLSPSKINEGPQHKFPWLTDISPGGFMDSGWSLIADRWEGNILVGGSYDNSGHEDGYNVWYMDGRVELFPKKFKARYEGDEFPSGFDCFDGGLLPPYMGEW